MKFRKEQLESQSVLFLGIRFRLLKIKGGLVKFHVTFEKFDYLSVGVWDVFTSVLDSSMSLT